MINIVKMTKEKYYSIKEVAILVKVTYLTVYRWIRAKKVQAYKIGKQYRVEKKDLDAFIKGYKG